MLTPSQLAMLQTLLPQVGTELQQLPSLQEEKARLRAALENRQAEDALKQEQIDVLRSLVRRVRDEDRQIRDRALRAEERAKQAEQERRHAIAERARAEQKMECIIESIEEEAQLRIDEAVGRAEVAETEARELAQRVRKERKARKKVAAERDQLRDESQLNREIIRHLHEELDTRYRIV